MMCVYPMMMCITQGAVPGENCDLPVTQALGSHAELLPTLLFLPTLKEECKPSKAIQGLFQ